MPKTCPRPSRIVGLYRSPEFRLIAWLLSAYVLGSDLSLFCHDLSNGTIPGNVQDWLRAQDAHKDIKVLAFLWEAVKAFAGWAWDSGYIGWGGLLSIAWLTVHTARVLREAKAFVLRTKRKLDRKKSGDIIAPEKNGYRSLSERLRLLDSFNRACAAPVNKDDVDFEYHDSGC